MLENALLWLVPIMLGWSILSIVYWCFLRQVLHDAVLFRIYNIRDNLRSMAINEELDPFSFQYDFLETRLCQTAYTSPEITVWNFFRFCLCHEAEKCSPNLDKFRETASEPLKKMWKDAIENLSIMMMINSPLITVFVIWLYLFNSLRVQLFDSKCMKFFEIEIIEKNPYLCYQ